MGKRTRSDWGMANVQVGMDWNFAARWKLMLLAETLALDAATDVIDGIISKYEFKF